MSNMRRMSDSSPLTSVPAPGSMAIRAFERVEIGFDGGQRFAGRGNDLDLRTGLGRRHGLLQLGNAFAKGVRGPARLLGEQPAQLMSRQAIFRHGNHNHRTKRDSAATAYYRSARSQVRNGSRPKRASRGLLCQSRVFRLLGLLAA